ncbi:hypothetical protein NDK47_27575 (plasmid) [Brevibacillus ruminantium]|uniref:Uncharacterized protein n=1 Tax=Brevibacillus ruminantium TaxID=2950604 RepID=A0ABY4WN10_9BACL|nr:hypothetical protein [Brevibacillus ruminantium]USG68563.1 hypothetical protein NDK47_27575 [Brevibacillus ruminantium]
MEAMVLVLGVDRYKMDGDISGCKMTYVDLSEIPDRPDDQQGYHAITENLAYGVYEQFMGAGIYRARFNRTTKTARNGKSMVALTISAIEPVEMLNFVEMAG